jgi:phage-related protein
MASIGKSVWELKESDERAWYRMIYVARIGTVIHVLHCFEKESRRTNKRDIATARARLKQLLKRIQPEKNR